MLAWEFGLETILYRFDPNGGTHDDLQQVRTLQWNARRAWLRSPELLVRAVCTPADKRHTVCPTCARPAQRTALQPLTATQLSRAFARIPVLNSWVTSGHRDARAKLSPGGALSQQGKRRPSRGPGHRMPGRDTQRIGFWPPSGCPWTVHRPRVEPNWRNF